MHKKILLISPYFPFPPHDGGKVRMFNLLKGLSRSNDVYLVSFINTEESKRYIPDLEKYCKKVFVVLRDEQAGISGEGIPRSVRFFYTQPMIDAVSRAVREIAPDLVQIDFLIMAQYINHIGDIPAVYTEHDMSNIDFEQSFHDRDLDEKERFIEWNKLVAYAKKTIPRFQATIVLTARDQKLFRSFFPGCAAHLIPTGVDVGYYAFGMRGQKKRNTHLLYVGHYKHYPNYDAIKYFTADIFPHILERHPGTVLHVVGSGVTPALSSLASRNVIIEGETVDIRPFMKNARVFVAPVRLGGGIKGKILEAMASGVPVVATLQSSVGIRCANHKNIIVAKDALSFARAVTALLENPTRGVRLAKQARALVEKEYSWDMLVPRLDRLYDTLLACTRSRKTA